MTMWAMISPDPYSGPAPIIALILVLFEPVICHGAAASNMSETAAVVSYELQFGIKLGDRREAIRKASPALESLNS
ncbi:MAG: hypothetical protein D8M59_13775 [Planctomycetes bacterium]|nr:hypothetical protein [Planctomycetota bacterium]NOG55577.1 hypothetical protein [Planctomycetota bacterium]